MLQIAAFSRNLCYVCLLLGLKQTRLRHFYKNAKRKNNGHVEKKRTRHDKKITFQYVSRKVLSLGFSFVSCFFPQGISGTKVSE